MPCGFFMNGKSVNMNFRMKTMNLILSGMNVFVKAAIYSLLLIFSGIGSISAQAQGRLISWGGDNRGQVSNSPEGNDFVDADAGYYHSIALKSDGSILVWGTDSDNQVSETPEGNDFLDVDA